MQQRRAAEEQRRRSLAREGEDGGGGAAERLTEEQREEQRTDNRAACGSSARTWGSISPTRRAGRQPLQGALWGQGLERGGTGSLHPGECCLGADRRFGLAAVGERARGVQRRLRHCDSSSTSSAAQSVARTAVAPSSMGLFAEVVDGHDGVADLVPRLICFLLERAPRLMCARQVGPPLRRNVHRLLPRRTGQRREWQPGSRGGSGPFPGRPLGHEASLAAWWLGALRTVSVFLGCDLTVKNDGSMARRSVASRNGPLGATYRRSCSTVRMRPAAPQEASAARAWQGRPPPLQGPRARPRPWQGQPQPRV